MRKFSNGQRRLKQRKAKEADKARKKRRHNRIISRPAIEIRIPSKSRDMFEKAVLVGLLIVASFLFSNNMFFYNSRTLNICTADKFVTQGELKKSIGILARNPYYYSPEEAKRDKIINSDLYKEVIKIVKDTPMEEMAELIAERDRSVAAFIVGIAMKESKFGKFSPKKEGENCFNYWGYRGKENATQSGYSCFKGPEEAIKVVGGQIERIVKLGVNRPEDMISWKCGRTCDGHSPESVNKWIEDVAINYYKLNPIKEFAKR